MDEVVTAAMEWEDKLLKVEKVYDDMQEILKIEAPFEMMPSELKDMVFWTTEEANHNYDKLKQKIFAMDVGRVACGFCDNEGWSEGVMWRGSAQPRRKEKEKESPRKEREKEKKNERVGGPQRVEQ